MSKKEWRLGVEDYNQETLDDVIAEVSVGYVGDGYCNNPSIFDQDGKLVAGNGEYYVFGSDDDLRLMLAAPDLLAALQAMVNWNGKRGGDDDALLPADQQDPEVAQAMQAIARANGDQV